MTTRTAGAVLRGVAALCALTSAVLHLMLFPSHLVEMPYIGILFLVGSLALIYTAVGLAWHNPVPAWVVGALVSAGMIVGLVLSRTVGLPGYREDSWDPPYGVLSMIAEFFFILAFIAWMSGRPTEVAVPAPREREPSHH